MYGLVIYHKITSSYDEYDDVYLRNTPLLTTTVRNKNTR